LFAGVFAGTYCHFCISWSISWNTTPELQRSMASQCFLSHYMHVGALILQSLFKLCIRARKTKKIPFQYISNI